jgi:hypothetical protein
MTSLAEINAATGLRAKLQQERIGAITSGARLAITSFLGLQSNILQMAEEIMSLDEGKPSEDGKPEESPFWGPLQGRYLSAVYYHCANKTRIFQKQILMLRFSVLWSDFK